MKLVLRFLLPVAMLSMAVSGLATDKMVYATEKGKKYHVKNCRLKHGSKGMTLAAAKKKGYAPCASCKPPK